ncbi:hypothetical protein JAO73_07630 [Hymenobacter sp. BT523]|uniref:hypothetical protein n=1 Tax=Hymenobacter sp. BT523 TaxID=2795725 RepID=UPI0018EE3BB7|nr:hypothetical protein [Hymenobacter sp. BT523]MBJ6108873.1 hypothetical protein [Hymenobacter sp. BT523]
MYTNVFMLFFWGCFALLSAGYLFTSHRRRAFAWLIPVYVASVVALTSVMFSLEGYLFSKQIFIEVGHAAVGLTITFFEWCFLALLIIIASFFTRRIGR